MLIALYIVCKLIQSTGCHTNKIIINTVSTLVLWMSCQLEVNSTADRKPVELSQDWCDVLSFAWSCE